MQHGLEGDRRRGRELIAQRQCPLGRQLRHQTFWQRLHGVVVLVFRLGRLSADGNDRALDHGRRRRGAIRAGGRTCIAVRLGLHRRRLVFRTDVAAIDRQRPLRVDADEDAGARNVGRRVGHRPIDEGDERVLDFAQPLIHLVRQFASLRIVGFERGIFGIERRDGRLLVLRESGGDALEPAQPAIVAVGEIDGDLDPLPAFGGDGLGLGLQLLGDETIE